MLCLIYTYYLLQFFLLCGASKCTGCNLDDCSADQSIAISNVSVTVMALTYGLLNYLQKRWDTESLRMYLVFNYSTTAVVWIKSTEQNSCIGEFLPVSITCIVRVLFYFSFYFSSVTIFLSCEKYVVFLFLFFKEHSKSHCIIFKKRKKIYKT